MKYRNHLLMLSFGLFFNLSHLVGVEERDYMNQWDVMEIPETESLPSIDVEELQNQSISVTYALDGGRFGDQITNYLKALWISWKYDVPLIYRPFDYSDQLVLSEFHQDTLDEHVISNFSCKVGFYSFLDTEKSEKMFTYLDKNPNHKNDRVLWNIGLLTPFIEEHPCEKMDDQEFRKLVHRLVKPKQQLKLLSLPKDRKSIAIHVRSGLGYDWEVNIRNMPTKFPPHTFYFGALKKAVEYFKEQSLYVYIFTDHPDPILIEEKFIQELKKWDLTNDVMIDCRRYGNHHNQNVLEDLFSMAQFDCLIRPDSSLSRLVAIMAAPTLEIRPSRWGEFRKDPEGNPILDKNGCSIIDLLILERLERGQAIKNFSKFTIEPSIVFE